MSSALHTTPLRPRNKGDSDPRVRKGAWRTRFVALRRSCDFRKGGSVSSFVPCLSSRGPLPPPLSSRGRVPSRGICFSAARARFASAHVSRLQLRPRVPPEFRQPAKAPSRNGVAARIFPRSVARRNRGKHTVPAANPRRASFRTKWPDLPRSALRNARPRSRGISLRSLPFSFAPV